jgi:hypothetical protein
VTGRSGSGILSFLLVLVAFFSVVPVFNPVSGVTIYSPGAKKGEWVYYGQISTYFQSNLPGVTSNPFITPFMHVASINSTVTNVSQDNITLNQLWTFDNGTSPRTLVLWGNVVTGIGNYTSIGYGIWFIPGGLSAGDSVGVGSAPMINETVVASYARSSWAVNVWNFTFNVGGVHQAIPFVWEESTGLLLEHSYLVSYPNLENGSLEIKATNTNIPGTNPDFTMTLSKVSLTTLVNTTATTTLTLNTSDNLTVSLAISSSPAGLACSLTSNTVNVKTSADSTLSCEGLAGTYQVTISGTSGTKSQTKTLTYQVNSISPAAPVTILGLNPTTFYAIVAAVVAAIIAVTAFVALRKRKPASEQVSPIAPQPSEVPGPPPVPPPVPSTDPASPTSQF